MSKRQIITIDGPSAAGKGSLARQLALFLNFSIFDSGDLYRSYAFFYNKDLCQDEIKNEIKDLIFIPEEDDTKILHKNIFYLVNF